MGRIPEGTKKSGANPRSSSRQSTKTTGLAVEESGLSDVPGSDVELDETQSANLPAPRKLEQSFREWGRIFVLAAILALVSFTTISTIFLIWESLSLDETKNPIENRTVNSGVLIALIAGSVAEVGLALRYIAKDLFPDANQK